MLASIQKRESETSDTVVHAEEDLTTKKTPSTPALVKASDHPDFVKYFRYLRFGLSTDQVHLKMKQANIDPFILATPDRMLTSSPLVKVSDHAQYRSYFKLMQMGCPREGVISKMLAKGLDATLIDTPDILLPPGDLPPLPRPAQDSPAKTKSSKTKSSHRRMRSLYWEVMSQDSISGTIWEDLHAKPSPLLSERHMSDLTSLFEIPAMTPPMPQQGPNTNAPTTPTTQKQRTGLLEEKLTPEMHRQRSASSPFPPPSPSTPENPRPTRTLIDPTRSNNFGIVFKSLKLSGAAITDGMRRLDERVLSPDQLESLVHICPNAEERAIFQSYRDCPMLLRNEVERFYVTLFREMPRYPTRLRLWQMKRHVPHQLADLERRLSVVARTCDDVAQAKMLPQLLALVLECGNCLNRGTTRGRAMGFQLSDLTKLSQCKATSSSDMTLLHYIAQLCRTTCTDTKSRLEWLDFGARECPTLQHIESLVCGELVRDGLKLRRLEQECRDECQALEDTKTTDDADSESPQEDAFRAIMCPFVDHLAQQRLALEQRLGQLESALRQVLSRYGELTTSIESETKSSSDDRTSDLLSRASIFFVTLREFSQALTKADRDNERRRLAKERKLRHERAATERRALKLERQAQESRSSTGSVEEDDNPLCRMDSLRDIRTFETLKHGNADRILQRFSRRNDHEQQKSVVDQAPEVGNQDERLKVGGGQARREDEEEEEEDPQEDSDEDRDENQQVHESESCRITPMIFTSPPPVLSRHAST